MTGRILAATMGIAVLSAPPEAVGQEVPDLLDLGGATRLEAVEIASVGGHDPREPYTFSLIAGGAVLRSGEVALIDGATLQIRIFSQGGVLRTRFGQHGQGPGEFSSVARIVPIEGDRLLAWDGGGGGRIVIFTLDGEHLETHRVGDLDRGAPVAIGGEIAGAAWSPGSLGGALDDGSIILRQQRPSPVMQVSLPPGPYRDSVRFVRYSPETGTTALLATIAGEERVREVLGDASSHRAKMFERSVEAAVAADGQLVFGYSENPSLLRVAPTGERLASWPLVRRARPVTPEAVMAERDRRVQEFLARPVRPTVPGFSGPPPEVTVLGQRRAESSDAHSTFPEFRRIVAGSDEVLWLEDYPLPNATQVRWYRVENGAATGWLDLPVSHKLLAAGEGIVVQVSKDEFDVETAHIMRIEG